MIYRFYVKDFRVQLAEEIDVHNPDTGYTLSFDEYLRNMEGIKRCNHGPLVFGLHRVKVGANYYIEGCTMLLALAKFLDVDRNW